MKIKVYLLVCVGSKPNPIKRRNRKFYAILVQNYDASKCNRKGWATTFHIHTTFQPLLKELLLRHTQHYNIPITKISKFNYDQKRCALQINRLDRHSFTQNLGGDKCPLLTLSPLYSGLSFTLYLNLTCRNSINKHSMHSILLKNTLDERDICVVGLITLYHIDYLAVSVRHCLSFPNAIDSLLIRSLSFLASITGCGAAAERVSIVNHTTNLNLIKNTLEYDRICSNFKLSEDSLLPLPIHLHQLKCASSSLCDVFYHYKHICQICSSLFLISIKTSVCGLLIYLINYRRYLTESAVLNV